MEATLKNVMVIGLQDENNSKNPSKVSMLFLLGNFTFFMRGENQKIKARRRKHIIHVFAADLKFDGDYFY